MHRLLLLLIMVNLTTDSLHPWTKEHEMWTHKWSGEWPKGYGVTEAWGVGVPAEQRGLSHSSPPGNGHRCLLDIGYECLEFASIFSAAWKGHHLSPARQSMSPPLASTTSSKMVSIHFHPKSPQSLHLFPLSLTALPLTTEPSVPSRFLP